MKADISQRCLNRVGAGVLMDWGREEAEEGKKDGWWEKAEGRKAGMRAKKSFKKKEARDGGYIYI